MREAIVVVWGWIDYVSGVVGLIAGSCGLALAVASHFRINRIDQDGIDRTVAERVDDATYALERRVATLEQDAGIGPHTRH